MFNNIKAEDLKAIVAARIASWEGNWSKDDLDSQIIVLQNMVISLQFQIRWHAENGDLKEWAAKSIEKDWQCQYTDKMADEAGQRIANEFKEWIGEDFEPPIVAFEDYSYDQAEYE